MEEIAAILASVFTLVIMLCASFSILQDNPHQSMHVTHIARQAIVEATESNLPEFIKKDRTVEYRYQWEWRKEWIALVQASCKEHYGKDQCNNCEAWDHSTPYNCSCDKFVQKNMAGEICLSSRAPDLHCDYHSKEHHFA